MPFNRISSESYQTSIASSVETTGEWPFLLSYYLHANRTVRGRYSISLPPLTLIIKTIQDTTKPVGQGSQEERAWKMDADSSRSRHMLL